MIHGGYDSISQEFMVMLQYYTDRNYNVYFFEGPGQGEVLMHHDVRMTPEWEHCTGAVLDHFGLKDVTLIGISLGGYLATRIRIISFGNGLTKSLMKNTLLSGFYCRGMQFMKIFIRHASISIISGCIIQEIFQN